MDINQVTSTSHSGSVQDAMASLYGRKAPVNSHASANGDSVRLSQESTILNQLDQGGLEWGKAFSTVPPIPHTAQELSNWFDDYRQGVREAIQRIFEQNDIQLQQTVTLQNGTDGAVRVAGTHPQAQAIQEVVNGNPQVARQLQSLNQRSDLFNVLAHGNNLRLAENQGEHSQAAAALSAHLNDATPFSLTISPSRPVTTASVQTA